MMSPQQGDIDELQTEEREEERPDNQAFQDHVTELQDAVVEMKEAFVAALEKLGALELEERTAREHDSQTRADTERQLAEALRLLLAFKTELGTTQQTVRALQQQTRTLERSVRTLVEERDALTHELLLSGALTAGARFRGTPAAPGSSGAPSSDSGVALLLERAHAAFSAPPLLPSTPATPAASAVNTLVQDYVAALRGGMSEDEEEEEEEDDGAADATGYDSECSLSLAAAKSLSLSTSLGQQCGLELEGDSGSDEARPAAPAPGLDWRDEQRLAVARELLAAEQSYCNTLHTMHDAFAEPLKASGILTSTDLNTLFPEEVWQLRTEHATLLAGLRARVTSWGSGSRLGDLLTRLLADPRGADVLRLYTSYANAFPEVLQTFHRLCRASPAFTRFLKSCLQRPACAGLDLGALLLTPVQHMPRYVLILRQLLHVTPEGSEEHNAIASCLARLRDFLARLNDSMEHSFQLVAAQIGAPRPQPSSRGQKTARRSLSHTQGSREASRSKDQRHESGDGMRRRQQRPLSARPTSSRRSSSEWTLTHAESALRRPRRTHTSDEDEVSISDLMMSSSEDMGSPSASCDASPGFSAISEPSLAEAASKSKPSAPVTSPRPLSSAQSVHNVSKNVTYVARTFWSSESRCDLDTSPTKQAKPKKTKRSLRASLKNILSFRKRCVRASSVPSIQAAPPSTGHGSGGVEVERSLKGLVQQLGRMPGYIELVVYCLRETAV